MKEFIPSMGVRRRGCHGGDESGSGDDQSHHGAGVSDACKKKRCQVKELVQKDSERSYVGIISLASLVSWHDSEKEGKEESSHFSSKKS